MKDKKLKLLFVFLRYLYCILIFNIVKAFLEIDYVTDVVNVQFSPFTQNCFLNHPTQIKINKCVMNTLLEKSILKFKKKNQKNMGKYM